MAIFSATDYDIVVNAVNLSDHISSVELTTDVEEQDDTTFGTNGWRSRRGGLKNGSITINFFQDFANSSVDATLWPLLGTTTTVVVKPTSDAVSATNPSYTGSFLVNGLTPVAGNVGDLAVHQVTWPAAGAITRAVA